jgi:uncharacterized membrane protein
MSRLTVLKFDTADGAENELKVIEDLSKQQMIKLQDAAIVTWVKGKNKPKTEHLTHLTRIGALSGVFWGLLFGILFFHSFGWSSRRGGARCASQFNDPYGNQ